MSNIGFVIKNNKGNMVGTFSLDNAGSELYLNASHTEQLEMRESLKTELTPEFGEGIYICDVIEESFLKLKL